MGASSKVSILSLDNCVKFPVIRSELEFRNVSTGIYKNHEYKNTSTSIIFFRIDALENIIHLINTLNTFNTFGPSMMFW